MVCVIGVYGVCVYGLCVIGVCVYGVCVIGVYGMCVCMVHMCKYVYGVCVVVLKSLLNTKRQTCLKVEDNLFLSVAQNKPCFVGRDQDCPAC